MPTFEELLLEDNLAFMRNHFLRTNYDSTALSKLSFLALPQSVLFWKPWTPDYLAFLAMARSWCQKHKDNLVLDHDKF